MNANRTSVAHTGKTFLARIRWALGVASAHFYMEVYRMRKTIAFFDEPTDFSLVQGGPLFQLLLRAGLLKPPTDLPGPTDRRDFAHCLAAPSLALGAVGPRRWRVWRAVSLRRGAHARLLLCVPLLIGADVIVHRRIKVTVRQFLDRGIVASRRSAAF